MIPTYEDPRPITGIQTESCLKGNNFLEKVDFDKIEPYTENGEMAAVTWFACIKDGEIKWRINGKFVVAVYYD